MTGRRGTTVLELVIALVVTAAVAAAGAAAFRQVIDHRRTVVEATRSTERAAALRATLREWIGHATLDTLIAPAGALNIVTNARTPAGTPGTRVHLHIDLDPQTPTQGLCASFRATAAAPVTTQELDGSITMLRVEYLDRGTGQWVSEPDFLTARPHAVRLTVPPSDETRAPLWHLPLTLVVDSLPLSTVAP
jgi:Tfp pilus assembly protein PilE